MERAIKEILEIHGYVACLYDYTNPTELMDRLTNLNVYLARTASILPDAEAELASARGRIAHDYPDESATRLRYILEAGTVNEMKFYRQVERLNATIVHQIDAIRTQISFIKAQVGR